MKKSKRVTFDIVFDERGNIKEVFAPGSQEPVAGKTLLKNPMSGVTSLAILALKEDDDPYVVQGGKCWVWR